MPGLGDEEFTRALGAYDGPTEPVADKPKNYTPKPPQMTPVPNPYKGLKRVETWDHLWRDTLDEFRKNNGREPTEQEIFDLGDRAKGRMRSFGFEPLDNQELYDWMEESCRRKESS